MRILTFLHSFEPGGVERVALRLVRHWRSQAVDAPLFMGRSTGAMRAELADSLDYHAPHLPPFAVDWFETLWMIVTLPGFVRRVKPDVLFCAGNSYAIVAVAMKLILGVHCPPVLAKISNDLDRRDMAWPMRMLYRLWLRIQGRFIDGFVGMEQPMEAEIAVAIQPRFGRIAIIPDPALSRAQIDRLRDAPRPAKETTGCRFVAVGRLASQKNFSLMIRAFAHGAHADDRLVIFGDGPERASLTALVARLRLNDRVTLAGHVPMPACRLADFDVFLLSSDYEGVPAVLLEALAVGLPIITTQSSSSIRSLMGDGALAHIVPVGDETAFARALGAAGRLTQDPAASLSQARRFTLEEASDAYLAAFATTIPVTEQVRKNSRDQLRHDRAGAVSASELIAKSSL